MDMDINTLIYAYILEVRKVKICPLKGFMQKN